MQRTIRDLLSASIHPISPNLVWQVEGESELLPQEYFVYVC